MVEVGLLRSVAERVGGVGGGAEVVDTGAGLARSGVRRHRARPGRPADHAAPPTLARARIPAHRYDALLRLFQTF